MSNFVSQVGLGSLCLLVSALIHVAGFSVGIPRLSALAARAQTLKPGVRSLLLLSAGIALVVAAHTVTIWFWALCFHLTGVFVNFADSFYFSTVTYTTLGYGDIVLEGSLRIFGSFAAITGLLTFGISTAFLIGLLVRILPDVFDDTR